MIWRKNMYYKIAGLTVQMKPKYKPLIDQINPYLYDGKIEKIDCIIPDGEDVIHHYQKKHPKLSVGDAEYILYGAYFYDVLLGHQGILLHASCIVYENYAYLFSAPSGTGKSTHTKLWTEVFPESFILNDDKPAIRYEEDSFFAYGTPFSGKNDLSKNERYPIAGIAFLKRGEKNKIKKMNARDAIINFLSQTMRPTNEKRLDQVTEILNLIIKKIPIYELECNMEKQAPYVSYSAMKR